MGGNHSTQSFSLVDEFGDELGDYLLDAPLRSVREMRLTTHLVTQRSGDFTGVAALLSREHVQDADEVLGALAQIQVTSPVFPKDIILRQPPRSTRFEIIWILEGRNKQGIIDKYLKHACKSRKSGIDIPSLRLPDTPISSQVVTSKGQIVELVTYRCKTLRKCNPLLKDVLGHLRLKNSFIRSVVDVGVTGVERGEFVCWVKMEYYRETLETEITRRRQHQRQPFTEIELINLLGQIVTGLNYAQNTGQILHPGVTPGRVFLTPQGVYKVDFELPWMQTFTQIESRPTILGETLLSAAELAAPSVGTDISSLPYSAKLKSILHRLLQVDPPPSLPDLEFELCEMSIQHLFTPFESEIKSHLKSATRRVWEREGPYRFSIQKHMNTHFEHFQPTRGGFYVGELDSKGFRHGRGIWISEKQDSMYEGEFDQGYFHGKGRMIDAFNGVTEGELCKGYWVGYGRYQCSDGLIIDSHYIYAKPGKSITGYGTRKDTSGYTYEGELYANCANGWGVNTASDGRYEGDWRSGYTTKGKVTYLDGSTYEGEFVNGQYEGKGVRRLANGDTYIGTWKAGQLSGEAQITIPGSWEYQGQVDNSQPHGQGECKYPNGSRYIGIWSSGNKVGRGVLLHSDGRREEVDNSSSSPPQ